MSENPPRIEEVPDDDAQPLTGSRSGLVPMRLQGEPPRVTRLSQEGSRRPRSCRQRRARRCADLRASRPATPVGRTTNSIRPRTARPLTDWPACREITVACHSSVPSSR